MQVNKKEEHQECFVEHGLEYIESLRPEEIRVDISRKLYQQLPANELRTARRPQRMAARTFFLERPFQRLQSPIDGPSQEEVQATDSSKLRLKVANKSNLSLEQYFTKSKFRCVYNRLENSPSQCKGFQGRLKGIDSLIDYNWKAFKELQQPSIGHQSQGECKQDSIDADFQSGNICRAYATPEEQQQFYLLMENDLNTYGYNNWFFYRLRNTTKGVRRFTIVNLIKKTSFYSQGMMVSIFSVKKNRHEGCKWFKGGQRVTFGSVNLPRTHHSDNYYSLSFQYDCQYEQDEVYFAMNQPYTYSRLVNFIEKMQEVPREQKQLRLMEVKTLGYSISNNIIPAVKITRPESRNKEAILILGRQHPCETVGSFIGEEMMRFMMQDNPISSFLLNTYDFIILPMVNPDGVIHGSSRCNMAGLDLNRQWGEGSIKELTPETVKIKQFILGLAKSHRIKYMIDLHGHGKKLNSFFFSCKDHEKEDVRLFSSIMKKVEPRFNFFDCTYGVSRDKEDTIRSTINNMGIAHSYTLETSLYGWRDHNNEVKHFNEQDYQQIAKSLLQSIFIIEASSTETMSQLGLTKEGILSELAGVIAEKNRRSVEDIDDHQILSDSDPEGDKLDVKDLLGKCDNKILKKKIQQEFNTAKPATKQVKMKGNTKVNARMKEQVLQSKRCFSNKNMRNTGMNIKVKLSATNHSFYKAEVKQSDKKVSLCDKWKERRREIEKKKVLQQKEFEQKELDEERNERNERNERTSYSRLDERARTKTEKRSGLPVRANMPHTAFQSHNQMAKTRQAKQKIKTEFKEAEKYMTPTEQELESNQLRKSALDLRFKQLKKESLNNLLTDTLSILKIQPSQKDRENVEEVVTESNRCSVKIKKQHLATEPAPHSTTKLMASEQPSVLRQSVRIKRYKQMLSGAAAKRRQGSVNSVFYYFPIL